MPTKLLQGKVIRDNRAALQAASLRDMMRTLDERETLYPRASL